MAENEVADIKNYLADEISFKFKTDDPLYKHHEGEEFCFKIPSVADRIAIETLAGRLRQQADPQGNGSPFAQHPAAVVYVENVATFQTLLKKTSAKWAGVPDEKGRPVLDWTKIPDDAPVSPVINQFNEELDTFRANRNKSG